MKKQNRQQDILPPAALFGGGFVGVNQKIRNKKPPRSITDGKGVFGKSWDDLRF